MPPVVLACPRCHAALASAADDALVCHSDNLTFQHIDGIWRFILPDRAAHFEQFVREYQTVRAGEGRGVNSPAYYRALPFNDLSGAFSADWRIRAASFRVLLQKVLAPFELSLGRPLQILDLGAGNGWLSNRLSERGHAVAAVDLQTNTADGLGAYQNYTASYLPVQAEFNHLPFFTSAIDLIIYNASFHYSEDYAEALAEAWRVLTPVGKVVVLDSPIYHARASGDQMVRDREEAFFRQFGFRSNALTSENYLTDARLSDLAQTLQMQWRKFTPYYGLRWLLRPILAQSRRHREPARFALLVGERR